MTIDPEWKPEREDVYQALIALLPPGAIWQNGGSGLPLHSSVMLRFFWALAALFADAEADAFSAFKEFNPQTADVTLDQWREDYGIPDEMDLTGESLALRVYYSGPLTLTDIREMAAAAGYDVTPRWLNGGDPEYPGVFSTLHLVISADSPAFTSGAATGPEEEELWVIDETPLAGGNADNLVQYISNEVPAHCAISYEIA